MWLRMLILIVITLTTVGFLTVIADAQTRKLKSSQTKISTFKPSDDERRKTVEKLMLDGGYQHDGAGELFYFGTIESVPALLKVLKDHPPAIEKVEEEENEPEIILPGQIRTLSVPPKREPRKLYICTYIHALNALQKITGQTFLEYQDWKNWWEVYLKNKSNAK